MASRDEKLVATGVAICLLTLTFFNRLYRVAGRNDLPMFSMEAIKAGWPYWVGILVGVIGYIGYWIYVVNRE